MSVRRITVTAIVLLVIAALLTAAAVGLGWAAASLQTESNLFGESINLDPSQGEQFTEEQYRYVNSLWVKADALLDLVTPAIIAAMAAVFGALSLWGVRWEARRRVRQLAETAVPPVVEPAVAS